MEENTQIEGGEGSVYEFGFLLSPDIMEEKLPEAFGALKEAIEAKGARALSEEFPKLIALAYTMEKTVNNKIQRYKEGYFGWIKFELEPAAVGALEAMLRLRGDLVRYLLIKTVRENTIAAKRGFGARRRPKSGTNDEKAAPEMSKEEIDREIEALVDDKPAA
jgi:ribosomal protein S6